jgi:hypothetical protein
MDEVGFTEPVNEDINESNPDELSSIQPTDEINKNIEIHPIEPTNTYPRGGDEEIPVVEVPGAMEPLTSDFPAASEDREFQPDLFQQSIIDEDNQARNEKVIDVTHRYNLRPSRSDWRDRYADHYMTLVF